MFFMMVNNQALKLVPGRNFFPVGHCPEGSFLKKILCILCILREIVSKGLQNGSEIVELTIKLYA